MSEYLFFIVMLIGVIGYQIGKVVGYKKGLQDYRRCLKPLIQKQHKEG